MKKLPQVNDYVTTCDNVDATIYRVDRILNNFNVMICDSYNGRAQAQVADISILQPATPEQMAYRNQG